MSKTVPNYAYCLDVMIINSHFFILKVPILNKKPDDHHRQLIFCKGFPSEIIEAGGGKGCYVTTQFYLINTRNSLKGLPNIMHHTIFELLEHRVTLSFFYIRCS